MHFELVDLHETRLALVAAASVADEEVVPDDIQRGETVERGENAVVLNAERVWHLDEGAEAGEIRQLVVVVETLIGRGHLDFVGAGQSRSVRVLAAPLDGGTDVFGVHRPTTPLSLKTAPPSSIEPASDWPPSGVSMPAPSYLKKHWRERRGQKPARSAKSHAFRGTRLQISVEAEPQLGLRSRR